MLNDKKFLIKLVIFVLFWITSIINICVNFSFWELFLELLVFLPVTIFMLINKDTFALLILILFYIFYIIMSIIGVVGMFINNKYNVEGIIYIIVTLVYYIGFLVLSIRVLMNKEKVNNLYVLILSIALLIVNIVNFFIDVINFVNVVLLINNLLFICYTMVYYIYLEEKEREIFH